jgi:pimeloyl-ACP methyl ester carboxylesterase
MRQGGYIRRWSSVGLLALCAAGMTSCSAGGDDASSGDSIPQSSTTASSATNRSDTGDATVDGALVDIGGGRHVFGVCEGKGSPTVVLENGDESEVSQWQLVFPTIAQHTRVCSYDRVGVGSSDPATGCRELPDLRADLEAFLAAEREAGPYVLVGTSGGGFLMAGFAYAHPAQVRGMVFAETPHAIVPAQEPASLLNEIRCDNSTNEEHRDYVKVENDAWSHRHRIGDIPMTVISNDYGNSADGQEQRTNVAGQRGWLVLSPKARQIVVRSGHDVPTNESALVIREILRVLAAAQ